MIDSHTPARLAKHARRLPGPAFAVLVGLVVLIAGVSPVGARDLTVAVLGDSLVAGYGLEPGQAFPEKLEAALRKRGHAVTVVNAGVSGDTTAAGLSRLDWSIPAEVDGVIIELGANDALRGLPPAATRANLVAILDRLAARGQAVLIAGMLAPPNLGEDYGQRFNRIYPELARARGLPLYPFFLDGVAAQPHLNQSDGIHPNARGVDVIVARFLPAAEKFLEALAGSDRDRSAEQAGN